MTAGQKTPRDCITASVQSHRQRDASAQRSQLSRNTYRSCRSYRRALASGRPLSSAQPTAGSRRAHVKTEVARDEDPESTTSAVVASEMSIASSILAILGGRLGAEGEEGGSRPRVAMGRVWPANWLEPYRIAHGRA